VQRQIDFVLPSDGTESLVERVRTLDAVITVAVQENGSTNPPETLSNCRFCGADEVSEDSRIVIATSDIRNLTNPTHQQAIENDTDEE
jgi:hypothetical protein